jgi:hypothetical protein
MTKKLSIAKAKEALGKGKGTGKKGWFGSTGRSLAAGKLNTAKT